MKPIAFTAILSGIALFGLLAPANAEQIRPNERYCIEMAEIGGPAGPPQCMFETMAQCIASKTAHNDRCIINPRLAGGEKPGR